MTAGIVITDNEFSNSFYQAFDPGNTPSFLLELTANVESPAPDQFSFAILDGTLTEIQTGDRGAAEAQINALQR